MGVFLLAERILVCPLVNYQGILGRGGGGAMAMGMFLLYCSCVSSSEFSGDSLPAQPAGWGHLLGAGPGRQGPGS